MQSLSVFENENESNEDYYIIQFKGRIIEEWKQLLEDKNAKIIGYVPNNAYLVKMKSSLIPQIESTDEVQWIGKYTPEYKISPELKDLDGNREDIVVVIFDEEYSTKITRYIESLGGEIIENSGNIIHIKISNSNVTDIANIKEVKWIEKHFQTVIFNDVARDIVGISYISNTYGLTGRGQIIGIADTGLDTGINNVSMHDDLEGRIINIFDLVGDGPEDLSGHGTHVAGSVLGNGNSSNGKYKGMAPEAELVFQAIQEYDYPSLVISENLTPIFQQAYAEGARIHSNSWGSDSDGQYTIESYYVDKFMWENPDMLILFAAGNDGKDLNSDGIIDINSIGSPATSKNCLSVGASENNRGPNFSISPYNTYGAAWSTYYPVDPLKNDYMANNIEGIAAFSSRGPTDDGRLKPDIVAPGTFIISARSSMTSNKGWGEFDENYLYMGGTSMATPVTAGAVALVRQNYVDNLNITPSAALIKATIINGAHDMTPGQYGTNITQEIQEIPDYSQGWGRLDVKESLYPTGKRKIHFCDGLKLNTDESFEMDYYINNSSESLKVSLVWTDYPGEPYSAYTLVNDLDLYVIGPTGKIFKEIDGINNVEQIEIQKPEQGIYTVIVNGFNVPQGPQPFSLVLSGITSELPELNYIEFSPEYPTINIGTNTTFFAHAVDQYGSEINMNLKWSSDNTTVGYINEKTGDFTATNVGTTNITAYKDNLTTSAQIMVLENTTYTTVFASTDEVVELRSQIFRGTNISEIDVSTNSNEFPYFYYSIEERFGTEKIYFNSNVTNPRTINEKGLVYYTQIEYYNHKNTDWGKFKAIGFFGEAYVPISNNSSRLSKLLINNNQTRNLEKNTTIKLSDGYALNIIELDSNSDKAYISLTKNEEIVDSSIVSPNNEYVYEIDMGTAEDITLIKIHFNDILTENGITYISINGIFQISDEVLEIYQNDRYGELQVIEIENDYLKLSNTNPIILEKGKTIDLTDEIKLNVLNYSDIRFYFMKNYTDIGSHELRGLVVNSSSINHYVWDGNSFSAFYYDNHFDLFTESLEITGNRNNDRVIDQDNLTYSSSIDWGAYKYLPWNSISDSKYYGYLHIGLFGKEYAVRKLTGMVPVYFPDKLYEIILNNNEKYVLKTEQKLDLGKGYELKPKIINYEEKSVLLEFSKDGEIINENLLYQNDTWTYSSEVDGYSNVEILKVHVSKICQIDTVEIEGIWLMSNEVTREINVGDEVGELYVDEITEHSLTFKNKKHINLTPGDTITIAENMKINVSENSNDVIFYPFMIHTITNEPRSIVIITPSLRLVEGESYNFTAQILDKSGNELNTTIKWKSSNTTVGTIEETTGLFNALCKGITTIIVSSGDLNESATINVTEKETTTTTKKGTSTSSGGGGSGTSGEKYENIEVKEVIQKNVIKGSDISYKFIEKNNAVNEIKFTALKNSGRITTTIEVLKNTSSFANEKAPDNVYQNMNIWVGNTGFSTSNNIKDIIIAFRVERSWILENEVIESSIMMCRYNDGSWNSLPTKKVGENQEHIFFESETPGFSPFAITGHKEKDPNKQNISTFNHPIKSEEKITQDSTNENSQDKVENKNMPSLSSEFVLLLLCCVYFIRKESKRKS